MAGDIKGLLLFPEAFGVLVLSKLYLVAKAALVPSMTETEDDLASANAKLAVLATLAGFVASPLAVGLLQLGAPWVLRLAFVVFLLGGVAAFRLPRSADTVLTKPAAAASDGRPILGPPAPDIERRSQGAGRPLDERPPSPTASARRGSTSPASASASVFRCMPPRSCSRSRRCR